MSSSTTVQQEQEDRAFLRERFLKSLNAMANRQIEFTLHEHTVVQATFGSSDVDVLRFQVSELTTPIGIQKEALLRCSDIVSYAFVKDGTS